jgi:hypothetical protein
VGLSSPLVATTLEVLSAVVRSVGALPDRSAEGLRMALLPLLPLLGPGPGALLREAPPEWLDASLEARPELFQWLRSTLDVEPVAPAERAEFTAGAMEVAGERRTAHPLEQGKVARLERVGLATAAGEILFPARVIRYEMGDGSELGGAP